MIDMSHYTVSNESFDKVFTFPKDFVLMSGAEVKIWCAPGRASFDPTHVLPPFLFWHDPTTTNGLRDEAFFDDSDSTAILLDPSCNQVAALTMTTTNQTLYYIMEISTTVPHLYIFSRYWNVISSAQQSSIESLLVMTLVPLIETVRVHCAYVLWSTPSVRSMLLGELCDVVARALCIVFGPNTVQSGVVLMRFSLVVDVYWGGCVLLFLDGCHSALTSVFFVLLVLEAISVWLRICSLMFVRSQSTCHATIETTLQRQYFQYPWTTAAISIGRELTLVLVYALTVLPPTIWSWISFEQMQYVVSFMSLTLGLHAIWNVVQGFAAVKTMLNTTSA